MKSIYRFDEIPIKISMTFFTETEKDNSKIHMGTNDPPQITKAVLNRMSNPGGITLPDFKLYLEQEQQKQHGTGTKTDM
jgi:hypothetical protein